MIDSNRFPGSVRIGLYKAEVLRYSRLARRQRIIAESSKTVPTIMAAQDMAAHYAIKALANLAHMESELGLEFSRL